LRKQKTEIIFQTDRVGTRGAPRGGRFPEAKIGRVHKKDKIDGGGAGAKERKKDPVTVMREK